MVERFVRVEGTVSTKAAWFIPVDGGIETAAEAVQFIRDRLMVLPPDEIRARPSLYVNEHDVSYVDEGGNFLARGEITPTPYPAPATFHEAVCRPCTWTADGYWPTAEGAERDLENHYKDRHHSDRPGEIRTFETASVGQLTPSIWPS